MIELVVVALVVMALLVLPFMLIGAIVKLFFGLVLLPFKLVGMVFKIVFGILGGILGLFFGIFGGIFRLLFKGAAILLGLPILLFVALVIPLLPFVIIGLGIWLVTRSRRRSTVLRAMA